MKNILIIYPHWPPSNLTGVHRPRLISNFLHQFGWHPIILTVKSKYYEEKPDYDIIKTVNPKTEVIYTEAKPIRKPRIIGDIGLRAFKYLKHQALKIIQNKKIDFIWIPIPSFYVAVLGRILHEKTGIPYGIDYIDPWIRNISNRKNLRAILSNIAAHILEPYAIKKASVISGVAKEYYLPALKRNFKQNKYPLNVAMPYGFDPNDHKITLSNLKYPWENDNIEKPIIYAGAFLPMSGLYTNLLFKSIKELIDERKIKPNFKLYFIGTGKYPYKSISDYAKENQIQNLVKEIPERYPYLHILNFLAKAYGILVIGTTEKHYTASKIFQSLLSQRPIFAIFHHQSTTVNILKNANADIYTALYTGEKNISTLKKQIKEKFYEFVKGEKNWQPNLHSLEKYSAKESTKKLVETINKAIKNKAG